MAIKNIEVIGKTEEDAVKSALQQLGMERDDVSVEILERARKGFLGIGASPAKIRVTYEVPDAPAPKPVQAERPPKPVPPRRPAPEPAPAVTPAPPAPPAAPQPKPGKAAYAEEGGEGSRRRGGHAKPARRPAPQPPRPAEAEEPLPPVDYGEPCADEKAGQITAFLTGLLEHMECRAEVKVYLDAEGRYKVVLEGEKLGALIGRRGETLDAIQQLTNYSVNKSGEKRVRIHVDAENYRLKREQSLRRLAQKVAQKVLKYRRSVTLEPMNAYERHVIHTAIQDIDGVITYSMGTEPNRRVIVAIDRGNTR